MSYDPTATTALPDSSPESGYTRERQQAVPGTRQEAFPLPSWEQRNDLGIGTALFRTFKEFYTYRITHSFKRMPVEGGIGGVALFMIMAHVLFHSIYIMVCGLLSFEDLSARFATDITRLCINLATQFAAGPPLLLVFALVAAWLAHGILCLVAKDVQSFDATARVVCYSFGTAQLLNVALIGGFVVGWIWILVVGQIGLRVAHGSSRLLSTLAMAPAAAGFFVLCIIDNIMFVELNGVFFLR